MTERVQGGLIGETLSRLGVAGLYTVVVLSISELELVRAGMLPAGWCWAA